MSGGTSGSCLLLGKVLIAPAGSKSEDKINTQTHSWGGIFGLTLEFDFSLSEPFTDSQEICWEIREDSLGRFLWLM